MELTGRECASLPDFICGGGNFYLWYWALGNIMYLEERNC